MNTYMHIAHTQHARTPNAKQDHRETEPVEMDLAIFIEVEMLRSRKCVGLSIARARRVFECFVGCESNHTESDTCTLRKHIYLFFGF